MYGKIVLTDNSPSGGVGSIENYMIQSFEVSNVHVFINELDGNRANQSDFQTSTAGAIYGVEFYSCTNCSIQNSYIHSTVETGIAFEFSSTDCWAIGNRVLDIGNGGTIADANCMGNNPAGVNMYYVGNTCQSNIANGIHAEGGQGIVMVGNVCYDCGTLLTSLSNNGNSGIKIGTGTVATIQAQITGNQSYRNLQAGIGVYNASGGISISGNTVYENTEDGIQLAGVTGAVVTGNVSYSNSYPDGTGSYAGIGCEQGPNSGNPQTSDVSIVGNQCYDPQTTKTQAYGIALRNSTADTVVTGNQLNGNTNPLYIASTNAGGSNIVRENPPYNPQGFAITTPAVPSSGTAEENTNPFPVRIYFQTTGAVTAVVLTDQFGTAKTVSASITVGTSITLDEGESLTLTYTTAPTWVWYGV